MFMAWVCLARQRSSGAKTLQVASPRITGAVALSRVGKPSTAKRCTTRSSRSGTPVTPAPFGASGLSRSPTAVQGRSPLWRPEYETLSTFGSYCGIDDLAAVSYANQLCNQYGMDTISCGATIAWAMDCYEAGLITSEDTGGIALRFGDADAMVKMTGDDRQREGFGDLLAEGSAAAAAKIGSAAEDLV